MAAARMRVGIISAGRVGTALGEALAAVGHDVASLTARSPESRGRAALRLPQARILDPSGVVADSQLLILAVPDTALPTVVDAVAAAGPRPGTIVAHTAGALGVAVLEPLARLGAVTIAVHPAMTFVGSSDDTARLASSCFGITSDDEIGDAIAAALVLEMGGTPVRIAESDRTLYHAALAHGANNLIALITDAVTALDAAIAGPHGEHSATATVDGPDPGIARRVLAPLVRASLDNVLEMGGAALTGPVARDDAATVRRHLAALAALPDHQLVDGYRALSARAASQSGAGRELRDLLEAHA
ncbi:Rossmann-like and DUF2520 domain-containing protein [Gordonia neofelifaecis]|uniref:Putative oxidoreductase/dehydrogenase, Rossmann-like domain-containing protein n=1 Tax=Gordonia neofelifaecis NRRL B-59395 TaxID=644548 RepID=F1YLN7_9ACTN|nr:Putative oxidoreductase/dehydrogenase, Rossmann- like domain-containing protein [Gordonia neofelifaecis NRRL B-59395]